MPIEGAADRAVFFSTDEFAVAGSYTLAAGGGAVTVNGIFDDAFAEVDTLASIAVGSSAPQFQCRSVDLPAGAGDGDTLVLPAGTFKVRVVQGDGMGVTTLILDGA